MINVLFFTAETLLNPILHSQGLPFFNDLDTKKYKVFVLHYERLTNTKNCERINNEVFNKYENLNYITINIHKNSFIPSKLRVIYYGVKEVIKFLKFNSVSIIHCRSFQPALLTLLLRVIYKNSIKFIFDNRGLYIEELILNEKLKRNTLLHKFYKVSYKWILTNADSIVVVSNYFKKLIMNQFGSLVNEKTHVIPNGTIIPKFNSIKKKTNRVFAVYSGSAERWQCPENLKEIYQVGKRVFEKFELVILSHQKEKFIEIFKDELMSENNITIYSVKPEEVKSELSQYSFGVLFRQNISINNVASPLKFAEYLSCGLPVLISRGIGDCEEVINKNKVGVVCEEDMFVTLTNMKNILSSHNINEKCYNVSQKHFNILDCYKKYEKIYISLLKSLEQE